jgi:DNA-binding GntR family transcriptional regulator
VTKLSEQEFDETIMLRSVLEPIALQLARGKASSKDIAALRRRLRDLDRVAAKGDQRMFVRKDYELHVAIWELSGMSLLIEVLKRVAAPVFVFEAILGERYRQAGYDAKVDAQAHRILIDYVAGKTDQDAYACLQPVLDVAMRAEKPIVFDRYFAPESGVIHLPGSVRVPQ